jgi:hypothetical protein
MKKFNIRAALIALAITAVVCAYPVQAGQNARHIYMNGERLDALGVAIIDQLNCGERVPNGLYWINVNTGAWGYEGGPMQGTVGNCRATEPKADSRYVEDRIFEQSGISIIQNPVYSR